MSRKGSKELRVDFRFAVLGDMQCRLLPCEFDEKADIEFLPVDVCIKGIGLLCKSEIKVGGSYKIVFLESQQEVLLKAVHSSQALSHEGFMDLWRTGFVLAKQAPPINMLELILKESGCIVED